MSETRDLYLGLMSGTSMDGIDAAILRVGDHLELVCGQGSVFPARLQRRLHALIEHPGSVSLDTYGHLDTEIGELFAAAALSLLEASGVDPRSIAAIGTHGQTVRHVPGGAHPFTLQIGDPNVIAARTGITTVGDFRRRDVALGGQGAPLAPAFHRAAFGLPGEARVVVNMGGMSNITVLGASGEVSGHDTGPGNVLLDAWAHQHHGTPFDDDGTWARSGSVDKALLVDLLAEDFFSRPPPKSTGRELFNLPWLTGHLLALPQAPPPENVQATLVELTARTVATSIKDHSPDTERCLVCGGGARNGYLIERLSSHLPGEPVESTALHGLAPDWVEAAAFAWLAWRTVLGMPGNLPAVTGASEAAVIGAVYHAG